MKTLEEVRSLSDAEVVFALDELVVVDRRTTAGIVAHLVVVKERSVHLDGGYGSIVDYCAERLGYSKDVAYKRSAAVKVAAEHPEVLGWLESGEWRALEESRSGRYRSWPQRSIRIELGPGSKLDRGRSRTGSRSWR